MENEVIRRYEIRFDCTGLPFMEYLFVLHEMDQLLVMVCLPSVGGAFVVWVSFPLEARFFWLLRFGHRPFRKGAIFSAYTSTQSPIL
jgi:hypothetical protein